MQTTEFRVDSKLDLVLFGHVVANLLVRLTQLVENRYDR